MQKISVILITKNEAHNIVRCLSSVEWADEVILLDSFSTDETLALASNFINTRIYQEEWKGFSDNKVKAISHTTYDWILWIDADEVITPELKNEIINLLNKDEIKEKAFDFPRKTFFIGEWVKHTGWYPGRVKRLFNKNFCSFNYNLLHEGITIPEGIKTGSLKYDMLHYSYPDLYQYFNKMNYYGKYGALEMVRNKKEFHFYQLILNPMMTFIKFFILKKGFLDGKKGFIISVGSAFSNFIKYTNFYYLLKNEKNNH